jgi:uncharacterized coiled-coil protein SlyX
MERRRGIAAFAGEAPVARLEDELTQRQARADRATAELTALAQRLADLAARPWWRRLGR